MPSHPALRYYPDSRPGIKRAKQGRGFSYIAPDESRIKDADQLQRLKSCQEIWATIVSEFSDIPDLSTITRITLRLLLAAILGGILGYEREFKARSAGVRMHMLVAVGAALSVLGPLQSGRPLADLSRVLQ